MAKKQPELRPLSWNFLVFTLFFTGAGVLVLEVLGARVLSPYFGVGLFVWSSLITVALIALSIGYWWGGRLADKDPKPEKLYFLILISGFFVLGIPLVSEITIKTFSAFGIRLGALLSGLVLFGPPLLILGMVSPFAVKLYTTELHVLGRRVGHLYAISTLGSCVGSLMTGFVLIPNISVNTIFYGLALSFFLLWAMNRLTLKKPKAALSLIPILLALSFMHFFPTRLSAFKGTQVVKEIHSIYGQLRVEEKGHKRWLLIDGAPNSGIDKMTGYSFFPYVYHFDVMPFIRPKAKTALLIGLGGGSIANQLKSFGFTVDAVEIDSGVLQLAKEYFYYKPNGEVFVQDAREYIRTTSKKYDFVILDVFSGDLAPLHLFSKEAFNDMKMILSPQGLLAFNYIGHAEGPHVRPTASIIKTLEKAFPHVGIYPVSPGPELQNIILLASDAPLTVKEDVRTHPLPEVQDLLQKMVQNKMETISSLNAITLTDNFNPLQVWSLNAAEEWRKRISQGESE